ncbi:MAG: Stage V sporulation protein D [bacterium ADurb.Bin400]|nr:MAG: Stage V sporulation protein D [bacterium ADurb.Bin400]
MSDYEKIARVRLTTMGGLVLFMSLVMLLRMFDIQVAKHGYYSALAQDQHIFEKVELAQRGQIYVRDSYADPDRYYPLAFDVKKFAVWAIPHQIKKKQEAAQKIAELTGISEQEIFSKIDNDKLYIPPIIKGLSLDEANKIKRAKLEGVLVVPEYSRYYPEGALGAHLLGFVNREGNGNYGFEGYFNDELKGKNGTITGEKDTLGRMINLLDKKEPQNGTSYVLTIDRSVQYYVEKKLAEAVEKYEAESGSVIVMDTETGGIVAMASVPTYDPNNYSEYANTDSGIFINPVIAHLYEPGSIMKPIIMAAALNEDVVKPETTDNFSNYTVVDGYEIHTAEDKAFGYENMTQVLENSDNVAMVWLSEKLGKEKMYEYLKSFGLFSKTGIKLDAEVSGYGPEVKRWRNIHRATISFGQGISVSLIEMVAAYSAIANDGVYVYPQIVDTIIMPDGTKKKVEKVEGERVIRELTANQLSEMLVSVVDNGHSKRAGVPGFRVAGKTGTAQIPKADGPGYEEDVYNHSLAGFAPAEQPRFAMITKIEKPKAAKYAEATAAPLFGEIASFLLHYYYRVPPTR